MNEGKEKGHGQEGKGKKSWKGERNGTERKMKEREGRKGRDGERKQAFSPPSFDLSSILRNNGSRQ